MGSCAYAFCRCPPSACATRIRISAACWWRFHPNHPIPSMDVDGRSRAVNSRTAMASSAVWCWRRPAIEICCATTARGGGSASRIWRSVTPVVLRPPTGVVPAETPGLLPMRRRRARSPPPLATLGSRLPSSRSVCNLSRFDLRESAPNGSLPIDSIHEAFVTSKSDSRNPCAAARARRRSLVGIGRHAPGPGTVQSARAASVHNSGGSRISERRRQGRFPGAAKRRDGPCPGGRRQEARPG